MGIAVDQFKRSSGQTPRHTSLLRHNIFLFFGKVNFGECTKHLSSMELWREKD